MGFSINDCFSFSWVSIFLALLLSGMLGLPAEKFFPWEGDGQKIFRRFGGPILFMISSNSLFPPKIPPPCFFF